MTENERAERMAALVEQKLFERDGWYGDDVFNDDSYPWGINVHTHGLTESCEHLDLQIVLPLSKAATNNIMRSVIDLIKEGQKFRPGDEISDVIKNLNIKIVSAQECDRLVLRIIFPDKNGSLDKDKMIDDFGRQYEGILDDGSWRKN